MQETDQLGAAPNSLDGHIKRKAQGLLEQYEQTGQVDRTVLEELETLQTLQTLFGPSRRKNRYVPLVVVGLVGVALALLLLLRVPKTEIELIVKSTDVGFTTSGNVQPIIESLSFREIGFNDVTAASLSNAPPVRMDDGSAFPVKLMSRRPKSITLEQLLLPSGSTVYLSQQRDQENYEAAVVADDLEIELELNGTKDFKVLSTIKFENLADGSLLLRGIPFLGVPTHKGAELLRFAFSPTKPSSRLAQQTQISSLRFTKAEVLSDTQNTLNKLVSGIESGSLYLESLNSHELILRPGELLRFENVEGTLRAVELDQTGLSVQFRGTVRGMKIGSEDAPRSIMPTLLEWLQARTSLITLLSGALALLSGLAAYVEWWRTRSTLS